MKMVVAVALAVSVLSGCTDSGPWDGLFGLKSGISPDQLKDTIGLEQADAPKAPKNVSVYRSDATPDGSISGADVIYAFDSESGLCGATIIDKFSGGKKPKSYEVLVSTFGPPGKKSDYTYLYPHNTAGLDESIDHILINVITPAGNYPGEFTTSIYYRNADRCLI